MDAIGPAEFKPKYFMHSLENIPIFGALGRALIQITNFNYNLETNKDNYVCNWKWLSTTFLEKWII